MMEEHRDGGGRCDGRRLAHHLMAPIDEHRSEQKRARREKARDRSAQATRERVREEDGEDSKGSDDVYRARQRCPR